MVRTTLLTLGALALALIVFDSPTPTAGQTPAGASKSPPTTDGPEKKFEDFDKVTKGAKVYEGLFHLHHKDDHLYAEIQRQQLDKPFLCPIAIARGMGLGGHTLNFEEQWVLVFRRVGDKIHLVRRNVHFQAKKDSPIAKAVETTYTDSVLLALKIHAQNMKRDSVLIDLSDIFMRDFAQLDIGSFDSSRSTWHKIKAFPRNIELEIAATFSGQGRRRYSSGDDSVIDDRGTTVVIHYGLCQLPEDGYQPRLADDRVGYFLSVVKDFSRESRDTSFLRYVNRWRLERADNDPKNLSKLSPPKKKIVFWIEKSVPDEYRAYVREGVLEWNRAFEKIGFRDAIEVRQQESEDFDPEDINYNTIRWITNDRGYAMGPSRTNPLTGEILDADIVFDADMVRYWKQEFRTLGNTTAEEPASLIQATRMGWGLTDPLSLARQQAGGWDKRTDDQRLDDARARLWAVRQGVCQCGPCKKYELGLAVMASHARGVLKPGEKVPEEMIGQAIKETIMHEVGHTLGLRHNFKASTMLSPNQLHDTSITRKQGLSGSVMDYNPVNLAPKGVKQGDYFSTTIGPYDYWAIEYAYKPLTGGTEGEFTELQKTAARGAEPGHDYGTDEDMFGTADPLINAWDLGSDPMKFAQDRILLAEELLQGLSDRVVDKGEGYQRARQAFSVLLGQYGNGAYLVVSHVGGEHINRDHRGDPGARDPFVPVKSAKQREALKFVSEHILTDKPFRFSPQLLRRLAADRWWHWGHDAGARGVDFPVHDRILRIQQIVLNHLFDPTVLARIQNNTLKAEKGEQPLTLAEVFRSLTDGIWTEVIVPSPRGSERRSVPSSIIRRNLQREHIKDLTNLVLGSKSGGGRGSLFIGRSFGGSAPADARSLARMHLREVNRRIEATLKDKHAVLDDTSRAHLEECNERIGRVLNASMQLTEP
jgi:hypothetical protein